MKMKSKEMQVLFEKYIKRDCTQEEIRQIVDYFKASGDLSDVPTIDAVSELLKDYPNMKESVANEIHNNILEIAQSKRTKPLRKTYHLLKYAAVAALFLGIGYLYQQGYWSNKSELDLSSEQITLELENGDIRIINEDGSTKIVDNKGHIVGSQNGHQLVYHHDAEKDELVYNTLTVPYGKRFAVTLSDGTVVNLNAGTSLRYPVKFVESGNRQVFLIGEAFFDVASDKEHPFIVNADNLNVEVFGTEFNVSAYPEDATSDVILVEGSVALYDEGKDAKQGVTIVPGTKGSFDKNEKNILTEKVDVEIYTKWISGGLVFRNCSFENIFKKLERHYNVTIVNTNAQLNKEVFNANFNEAPINMILNDIKSSFDFDYRIEGNTVYIK